MIFPGPRLPDSLAQLDAAVRAEVAAGLAGIGVERDQIRVRGAVEDPLGADRARRRLRVFPVRDAATDERIRPLARERSFSFGSKSQRSAPVSGSSAKTRMNGVQ